VPRQGGEEGGGSVCRFRSYGVMVSTLDSESSDPGSNPGMTSFFGTICKPDPTQRIAHALPLLRHATIRSSAHTTHHATTTITTWWEDGGDSAQVVVLRAGDAIACSTPWLWFSHPLPF
jgi:hypothetical protein